MTALVAVPHPEERISFTPDQVDLIKRMVAPDCTNDELAIFLHHCSRTGLDPLSKQIYAIRRNDRGRAKMTIQTGIDGYRAIADRTNRYAPGRETTFTYDSKQRVLSATAYVQKMTRDGTWHEVAATAYFSEYDAGGPMWQGKPHVMLGKCAEALALRRAFPAELSGLYTNEEMDQAGPPVEQRPMLSVPAAPAISPEADKAIDKETALAEMADMLDTTMAPLPLADTAPVAAPPPVAPPVAFAPASVELRGPEDVPLPTAHATEKGPPQGPMYFLSGKGGPEDDPDPALTEEYTESVPVYDVHTGEKVRESPGITSAQNRKIHALRRDLGHLLATSEKNPVTGKLEWVADGKYRKAMLRDFGKVHTNELTAVEANTMIDRLMKLWTKKSKGTNLEGREPGQEG